MNKTIRHTSVFVLVLVLALLGRATWVQAYEGKALADDSKNRRKTIAQYAQPLGNIVVAGSPVTGSKKTEGGDLAYKRTYTDGELYAAVTGYSSQAYGATQLEGIYDSVLDGTDTRLKNPVDAVTRQQQEPGTVVTTIDPDVQKAGYEALGNKKGAAVAVDPATGRILGMVSTPSYDDSGPEERSGPRATSAALISRRPMRLVNQLESGTSSTVLTFSARTSRRSPGAANVLTTKS